MKSIKTLQKTIFTGYENAPIRNRLTLSKPILQIKIPIAIKIPSEYAHGVSQILWWLLVFNLFIIVELYI